MYRGSCRPIRNRRAISNAVMILLQSAADRYLHVLYDEDDQVDLPSVVSIDEVRRPSPGDACGLGTTLLYRSCLRGSAGYSGVGRRRRCSVAKLCSALLQVRRYSTAHVSANDVPAHFTVCISGWFRPALLLLALFYYASFCGSA